MSKKKKIRDRKIKVALYLSIASFVIGIIQTIIFSNQTAYLKQQTNTQNLALEAYKKDALKKNKLEEKRMKMDENFIYGRFSIIEPTIIKNPTLNYLMSKRKPYVLSLSGKNIGKNPISKYEIGYMFFINLKLPAKSLLYQIKFETLKREGNKIIVGNAKDESVHSKEMKRLIELEYGKVEYTGASSFSYHSLEGKHKNHIVKSRVITDKIYKDSIINIYTPDLGIFSEEKLLVNGLEGTSHNIYLIVKIKYQDEYTTNWNEVYGFYSVDNNWNIKKNTIDKNMKTFKKIFQETEKNKKSVFMNLLDKTKSN
jgi:hypothetical protein